MRSGHAFQSGSVTSSFQRVHARAARWCSQEHRPSPSRLAPSKISLLCFCESSDVSTLRSIPIFPLGMVALPTADVPLQIFEARYRVLFHTLLSGGEGIEPELVQDDSPFKGSRKFGMCYVNNQGLSAYGTVLEIKQHQVLPDGRLLVLTRGRDRFKVQKIQQERPVLLCEVEMLGDSLEDNRGEDETLQKSAERAKELFRSVLELNARYKKMDIKDEHLNPPELQDLPATKVSFWIASMFSNTPEGQQKVLEIDSPQERLDYIISTLDEALKHTTAAMAIDSVFSRPTVEEGSKTDGESPEAGKDEPPEIDSGRKPRGPD